MTAAELQEAVSRWIQAECETGEHQVDATTHLHRAFQATIDEEITRGRFGRALTALGYDTTAGERRGLRHRGPAVAGVVIPNVPLRDANDNPIPPPGLSAASAEWFDQMADQNPLPDTGLRVLGHAACAFDRGMADFQVAQVTPFHDTPRGREPHPAQKSSGDWMDRHLKYCEHLGLPMAAVFLR